MSDMTLPSGFADSCDSKPALKVDIDLTAVLRAEVDKILPCPPMPGKPAPERPRPPAPGAEKPAAPPGKGCAGDKPLPQPKQPGDNCIPLPSPPGKGCHGDRTDAKETGDRCLPTPPEKCPPPYYPTAAGGGYFSMGTLFGPAHLSWGASFDGRQGSLDWNAGGMGVRAGGSLDWARPQSSCFGIPKPPFIAGSVHAGPFYPVPRLPRPHLPARPRLG